jgi:hypothetical protein
MKKIFSSEYPDLHLVGRVEDFIKDTCINNDGSLKVFRPTVIVEIFDQHGEPVRKI